MKLLLLLLTISCAQGKSPLIFEVNRPAADIIKTKCILCHKWAKSDDGILKMIVKGDPEASPLYQWIADDRMPPQGALSVSEKKEVYDFIKGMK